MIKWQKKSVQKESVAHVILIVLELCGVFGLFNTQRLNAPRRPARDFQLQLLAAAAAAARCASDTTRGRSELWNPTPCQRCRRRGVPESNTSSQDRTGGGGKMAFTSCCCSIRRLVCTPQCCSGPGCCVGAAATRDLLWFRGDLWTTVASTKIKWTEKGVRGRTGVRKVGGGGIYPRHHHLLLENQVSLIKCRFYNALLIIQPCFH